MRTHSILAMGVSGAGKSHLVRTAIEAEGSALLVLCPGEDEINSYVDLDIPMETLYVDPNSPSIDPKILKASEEGILALPFDDEEYFPSLGEHKALGWRAAVRTLMAVAKYIREECDRVSPWKIVALDTYTGLGDLAKNRAMSEYKYIYPPPAMSPDGAAFWSALNSTYRELLRPIRVIRSMGAHILATAHVTEKEKKETSAGAGETVGKSIIQPIFSGSFRDECTAPFDLVFQVRSKGGKHFMHWQTSGKHVAKSRLGDLNDDGSSIPNTWEAVLEGVQHAQGA